jgi:hypothetical protein
MRLATGCDHAWLIYRTIRGSRFTVRYRRCRHCGECSKTIQAGFVDARSWWDRRQSLPDATTRCADDAIMASEDSRTKQEAYDDERYR